jgi:hypothetical protein
MMRLHRFRRGRIQHTDADKEEVASPLEDLAACAAAIDFMFFVN